METVRISKVEGNIGKSGKAYYVVTLEDGRKATTFDVKARDLTGALVGADVTQNGQWTNIKILNVLAQSDRPSVMGMPLSQQIDVTEKARTNPVFAFLGACTLAAPIVLENITAGNNIEDTLKALEANFSPFLETATRLYKTHLELSDMAETADKLMN